MSSELEAARASLASAGYLSRLDDALDAFAAAVRADQREQDAALVENWPVARGWANGPTESAYRLAAKIREGS